MFTEPIGKYIILFVCLRQRVGCNVNKQSMIGVFYRFIHDIYSICGVRLGPYWKWSWMVVGPVLMGASIFFTIFDIVTKGLKYDVYMESIATTVSKSYPTVGVVVISLLIIIGIIPIPLMAILRKTGLCKYEFAVKKHRRLSFSTREFRPASFLLRPRQRANSEMRERGGTI